MTSTPIREEPLPADVRPGDNATCAIKVYKVINRRGTCGSNV